MQATRLANILLLVLMISPAALAQEPEEEHEGEHRNEVALLLGATYEAEEERNFFTVGGEYARRLGDRWTVAASIEHLPEPGAWVFAFPVTFRVYEGFRLSAGPGFEGVSRRSLLEEALEEELEGEEIGDRIDGRKRFFLFRVGASYGFEIGERYSLRTGVAVDWVDALEGTVVAVVYGVSLGVGF